MPTDPTVTPVVLDVEPFGDVIFANGTWKRYHWPAKWIGPAVGSATPIVFAMRRTLTLGAPLRARVHVSADERFELYLNGTLVARGPHRGDLNHWRFQTFDIELPPGRQVIVARVWAWGATAPMAQVSAGPAFLLAAEGSAGEQLSTGVAMWEMKRIDGLRTINSPHISQDGYPGKRFEIDGNLYPWNIERGDGEGWVAPAVHGPAMCGSPTDRFPPRRLTPSRLPPMRSAIIAGARCRFAERLTIAGSLLKHPCVPSANDPSLTISLQHMLSSAGRFVVPAGTRVRAIIDLDDYYCAYPHLTITGGRGGRVSVGWAEALVTLQPRAKGNRDEIENKAFCGYEDHFLPDGAPDRRFSPPWWQAGRYLQLDITAADEPVSIDAIELEETRFPFGELTLPAMDDVSLARAAVLCRRALEVCNHETFVDTPYYEQLGYTGDARLQALALYTMTGDDRPMRNFLELLAASQMPEGMLQSRYPCRVLQVIAPFSLLWIGMLHDFACWRADRAFVRGLLPAMRRVVDAFVQCLRPDGLIESPAGWNFIDWSGPFVAGEPAGSMPGTSAPLNWQTVLAMRWARELEQYVGEPECAARFDRHARSLAAAAHRAFWSEARGAYADTPGGETFSEHAQALAIESALAPADACARAVRLLEYPAPDVAAATIYFEHYTIEALRRMQRTDAIVARLEFWRTLPALGFRALPEKPEPSRSDSHAWGAHLVYHLVATLAGIRPAGFEFAAVSHQPIEHPYTPRAVTIPHPLGRIDWTRGQAPQGPVPIC